MTASAGRGPRRDQGRDVEAASRGLTLVELLVVLTILVILAGVAVTATEGLVEQARFDASARTLGAIEEGALGPADLRGSQGDAQGAGFVADMGRLPSSIDELVTRPIAGSLSAHALDRPRRADGGVVDGDVLASGGWRGPYVRPPLGGGPLLDGWGRPLVASLSPGSPIVVTGVASLGASGEEGGSAFELDQRVSLGDGALGVLTFSVEPFAPTGTSFIVVRLYGPSATLGRITTIAERTFAPGTPPDGTFLDAGSLPLRLPVGPRVLRAYRTGGAPASPEETLTGVLGASRPVRVVVGARVDAHARLVIE